MTQSSDGLLQSRADITSGQPGRFRWRWGLLAAAASLASTYLTRAPGLTEWDSYEYAGQAINGTCSGLGLGRWWFNWLMHSAYMIGAEFGLDKLRGCDVMRAAVALMTAGAVVALMCWTFLLARRMAAANAAAVMALASTSLLASASAVMTEGPTLLALMLAYVFWEKSLNRFGAASVSATYAWALAAGLAFGLTVNMREPALMLCVWPIATCFLDRPKRRWFLLALAALGATITLAIGIAMAREVWLKEAAAAVSAGSTGEVIKQGDNWFAPITRHLGGYLEYMRDERSHYGWPPGKNVLYLFLHTYLSAPLLFCGTITFVLWRILGGRRLSQPGQLPGRRMAALAMSTLPYCLATWYNPSLSFNFRLALPLGWTLIPIAAAMIVLVMDDAWAETSGDAGPGPRSIKRAFSVRVFMVGGALIASCSVWYHMDLYQDYCGAQEEVFQGVLAIPEDANGRPVAVVGGPGAPMVIFLNDAGVRPDMVNVIPGFHATPESMYERMGEQLDLGRRVFVNTCAVNQARPDGKCFEYTATLEAAKRFRQVHLPGQAIFVEILPGPTSSATPAP